MDFSLYPPEYQNLIPAYTPPKKDEILSSWIIRLAQNHNLKAHDFCKLVFPKIEIWNRDIDRHAPDKVIDVLSKITPCTLNTIRNSLLSSYKGFVFPDYNQYSFNSWILLAGVYHRTRKNKGMMYCPKCLSSDTETPYYRKFWRLALFTVCPSCGCYLRDTCPQCGSPIVFFRNLVGIKRKSVDLNIRNCFHCNFDLSCSEPQMATRRFIRMQHSFLSIMVSKNKDFSKPTEYFDVLFQLVKQINARGDASAMIRERSSKEHKLQFLVSSNKFRQFNTLSVEERLPLLFMAYWLLLDWPERFISYCRDKRLWSSFLLKDFSNPPEWYIEIVKQNLLISNRNRKSDENRRFFSYY